jgi:predicted nuclease of predicted toxin-antitoxin system
MFFKADENLPVEVAGLLRQHGHDAVTVGDQQLAGPPDVDIAQVCRAEQRAIITLDLDFADIRAFPPGDYAGIIVLRPSVQTIPTVLRLIGQVIAHLASEPLAGHLWIVDDNRIRIRGSAAPGST